MELKLFTKLSTIIKTFAFNDNVVDDVVFLLPDHQDSVTTS